MTERIIVGFSILSLMMTSAMGAYWWYAADSGAQTAAAAAAYKTPEEEQNVYVRFDMEIFDIIMANYWQAGTEADLAEVFRLALAKAAGTAEESLPTNDRAGTAAMLAGALERTPEEKRKSLVVDTAIIVLANLAPQGRSGLLSEKQEQQFRDTANNIDRGTDLYATLGVDKGASVEKVQEAYEEKATELQAVGTPEAEAALKQVERAKEVLADVQSKAIYDETKIEPSVVSKVIGTRTFYLDLSKVTPATLQEFVNTLEKTKDNPQLTAMIIDVRGNIGGTLDFAKYLLALFVGPNQYAFDLFHKGELQVERTPAVAAIPSLKNFKEIAILTDAMTQSTAELTAVIFKRLNRAKVVGTKTRGWGSVENTFPVETRLSDDEKYSVLLVHSLTLREDNEPIEGRGVDPDIDTSAANWKQELSSAFRTPGFVSAIIEAVGK
ncbi:MAG: S41 family peptidase [Patescibacteria group bacterium]